jgi:DNA helicase-2/ATP-dependent DNA helicase PcrA
VEGTERVTEAERPRSNYRDTGTFDFAAGLNPVQGQAVLHGEGPLLILAGAGSGKTRVLTHRIARLIAEGTAPWAILAVTFTNKAAAEMRHRVEQLVGEGASGLWMGTFHSVCARLLRRYAARAERGELPPEAPSLGLDSRFVIYDDSDQRALVTQILRELNLSERISPRAVLGRIDDAKDRAIGPADYSVGDFFDDTVFRVYPRYQERLRQANAVDFGDLLVEVVRLLERGPDVGDLVGARLDHVLVDEFQDTNAVQYRLVRLLSARSGNLCVVGDDDQSIYRWRGADLRNILDFERDHPTAQVLKLEQNYRSTQLILEAANAVISRNVERKSKRLWTDNGQGEPIVWYPAIDDRNEAAFIASAITRIAHDESRPLDDLAVFYRTHAQSRAIEEALRAANVPYRVVGGLRFYDRAEIKDLIAYLRVIAQPRADIDLLRIVNTPSRGIGDTTLERLAAFGRRLSSPAYAVSLWEAALLACTPPSRRGDELNPEAAAVRAHVLGASPPAAAVLSDPRQVEAALPATARRRLGEFVALMQQLKADAATLRPSELCQRVLERTTTLQRLEEEGSVEAEARMENLREFVTALTQFEAEQPGAELGDFLERIALSGAQENADAQDSSRGTVSLMTIHSAKGLEFPVVLVAGLEEGIFPSQRGSDDPGESAERLEEERRLAYVAITRARERLFLLSAGQRMVMGQTQWNPPSRFLEEIPPRCLVRVAPPPRPGGGYGGACAGGRAREQSEHYGESPASPRSGGSWGYGAGRPAGGRGGLARPGASSPLDGEGGLPDDGIDAVMGPRPGSIVRHAQFGQGQVRATSGSGTGLKLVVRFPSVGDKTILARFVEPLEDEGL